MEFFQVVQPGKDDISKLSRLLNLTGDGYDKGDLAQDLAHDLLPTARKGHIGQMLDEHLGLEGEVFVPFRLRYGPRCKGIAVVSHREQLEQVDRLRLSHC